MSSEKPQGAVCENPSELCPPVPDDEEARIRELVAFRILDTPPEAGFDSLVRLAARHFAAPVALISLVAQDRQWFKARVGIEAPQTERCIAFCAHAILADEPFVVEDATDDERFRDNPLVRSGPHIRFYAGAPLVVRSGARLGTFCVIDSVPREFDAESREALRDFAQAAVELLEDRRSALLAADLSEELSQRNRDLRDFAHSLAHDLRAPLRHLKSFGELLTRSMAERVTDRERRMLGNLGAATRRMDDYIKSIYVYAAAGAPGELESVNAHEVAREVIAGLQGVIRERKADVAVRPLPTVLFERVQLHRLIQNLVENAIKYGGPTPKVEVVARCDGDGWHFEVRDDGPGVPTGAREEIFQPFRRCSADTSIEGSGMGLSICRRIVEGRGGRIWVQDDDRPGSTFCFTVPERTPQAAAKLTSGMSASTRR